MIRSYTSHSTHSQGRFHSLTLEQVQQHTPYTLPNAAIQMEELINGTHLRQVLNFRPFLVDLRQVNSTIDEEVNFHVAEGLVTLTVVINGQITVNTVNGNQLYRLKKKKLCMAQAQPGNYTMVCKAKKTNVLLITFLMDWLEDMCMDFPNIMGLIQEFKRGKVPFSGLPICLLDQEFSNYLNMLYQLSQENKGVMDGEIRICFSLLLQHYEEQINLIKGQLAYKIKLWLDDHYVRDDLNLDLLADEFFSTADTIRKNFQQVCHCTPHTYYTRLRMQHAHHLITIERQSIQSVYPQVGYRDERSFRYEYQLHVEKLNKNNP